MDLMNIGFSYSRHAVRIVYTVSVVMCIVVLASASCVSQLALGNAAVIPADPKSVEGPATPGHSRKPLACPTMGFLPIETSKPDWSHHTVILSWNPGAPSPQAPAGYCLYKSDTQINPRDSECSSCQPVTSVPIAETSCVDDVVKDGTTYYYLVRAIDGVGRPSGWSNVARAKVPASAEVKTSAEPRSSSISPPGLCRVPSGK